MRRIALLAALAALGTFAATVPAAAPGGTIDLRIVFRADPSAAPRLFTLRCANRSVGTVPRPSEACRRLRALGESAFRPTPPGTACTEIWGGPSTAQVTGTTFGRRLWVRLRRDNGCEIARWQRVGFLLPRPASAS
jgi:hypothetical protein